MKRLFGGAACAARSLKRIEIDHSPNAPITAVCSRLSDASQGAYLEDLSYVLVLSREGKCTTHLCVQCFL